MLRTPTRPTNTRSSTPNSHHRTTARPRVIGARTIDAFDFSYSMDYPFQSTTKIRELDRAYQAAIATKMLLSPQDQLGIVTFSDKAHVIAKPRPVTDPGLRRPLTSYKRGGQTNMHAGLKLAIDFAKTTPTGYARNIRLWTDGSPNVAPYDRASFEALAALARRFNITIHTIGIGTPGEVHYDPELLKAIVHANGFTKRETGEWIVPGTYTHVQTYEQMLQKFNR